MIDNTRMDPEQDPTDTLDPRSGDEAYDHLPRYASRRHSELSRMLAPALERTNAYGRLIARLVWQLGLDAPGDDQDRIIRDLVADTFDFLVAWEERLLQGKETVAYPLGRRAYESLSLLSACIQDAKLALRWGSGAQIQNHEIRRYLASAPFSESEAELKELYRFFSQGAHPNRALVPRQWLGEGNQFTLGSIGVPDVILIIDHFLHLLGLWVWFAAAVGYRYRELLDRTDSRWGADYMQAHSEAQAVGAWLIENYNRLLTEVQPASDPHAT